MGLKELWTGGEEVQEARKSRQRLEEKGRTKDLKERERTKLAQNVATTRRHFLKRALGTVAVVGGGVATIYYGLDDDQEKKRRDKPKNPEGPDGPGNFTPNTSDTNESSDLQLQKVKYTLIEHKSLTATIHHERMMELQAYWKKLSIEAIAMFEKSDPRVQMLIQFMNDNAFYTIPRGPAMTVGVFKGKPGDKNDKRQRRDAFEVVYMPERYARTLPSSIVIQNRGRTMRVATNFQVKEWLGIMLIHELSHIYDLLVEGENLNNRDEYFAGEVKAHKLENKLISDWDPEAYKKLIKHGIPLFKKRDKRGLIMLVKELYPVSRGEASRRESSLGIAACITAIAFEEAIQAGKSDEELKEVYAGLARFFRGR